MQWNKHTKPSHRHLSYTSYPLPRYSWPFSSSEANNQPTKTSQTQQRVLTHPTCSNDVGLNPCWKFFPIARDSVCDRATFKLHMSCAIFKSHRMATLSRVPAFCKEAQQRCLNMDKILYSHKTKEKGKQRKCKTGNRQRESQYTCREQQLLQCKAKRKSHQQKEQSAE